MVKKYMGTPLIPSWAAIETGPAAVRLEIRRQKSYIRWCIGYRQIFLWRVLPPIVGVIFGIYLPDWLGWY